MTLEYLQHIACKYNPRKVKIKNLLKRVTNMELDILQSNNKALRMIQLINDTYFTKKMIILECPLNIKQLLPYNNKQPINTERLYNLKCDSFKNTPLNACSYCNELLFVTLRKHMKCKQVIVVMLSMEDYMVSEIKPGNIDYETHSTCLIFIPDEIRHNKYLAYYINPHGREMKDVTTYTRVLTRSRTSVVKFNEPYEIIIIDQLIKFLNTVNTIQIYWKFNNKHTYYSTNLQSGDSYGICYVYPILFVIYIGFYYNNIYLLNINNTYNTFNTGKALLTRGDLTTFVKISMVGYYEPYNVWFINTHNTEYYCSDEDPLNEFLETSGTSCIKSLLYTVVRYMNNCKYTINRQRIRQGLPKIGGLA
jgi:hypothetical protein